MRHLLRTAGLCLTLFLLPFPSWAAVTVQFIEPQQYTDIETSSPEQSLRTLGRYLQSLGQRCLDAGDQLQLQILDVDLAGSVEWWHRNADSPRVMREVTRPRIDIAYSLSDATGRVFRQGKEHVIDMEYLSRSAYVRQSDELPYEKHMLADWFDARFCKANH